VLSYLAAGAAGLALGLGAPMAFGDTSSAPGAIAQPSDATQLEARLAALEDRFDQAASERLQLGLELAQLRQLAATGGATTPPASHAAAPDARPHAPAPEDPATRPPERAAEGLSRLRARSSEIELAQLELRDRALREGWLNAARYRDARRELNEELFGLRDEFGDEVWDWMLYDTGHDNRVVVGQVIAGSAAEDARLATGDVLLSYDGRRVFSLEDVREAQLAGAAGENVELRWLRDGSEQRSFLPRGPLGVRIGTQRAAPDTGAAGS
jgi:hypothetical protein